MPLDQTAEASRFKLGSSPYWLNFIKEEHGLTASWRLGLSHVPPRARTKEKEVTLLEVTPRRPFLTIVLDGETYPLMIDRWEKRRGTSFTIEGSRKLGRDTRQATWSADVVAKVIGHRVQLDMQLSMKIDPKPRGAVRIRLSLPVLFSDPLAAVSEIATVREDRALIVWDMPSQNALSFMAPAEALVADLWDERGQFVAWFTDSILGARKKVAITLGVGHAATGSAVKDLLLEHYAATHPILLPQPQEWGLTLCQTAAQAVTTLCDKGAYDVRGVERAYFLPPREAEMPTRSAEFFSGYPYFPVDASRALLDWSTLTGDEFVGRVAKLGARGVASDFSTTASTGAGERNKGAFWDRLHAPNGPRSSNFSGFDGEPSYSILSNARIARALLDIHARTGEELFGTMALNACKWLMLRQNTHGYYGGDRYRTTGEYTGGVNALAGVEAIPAFVGAFRATMNEVFIRAAWKVANHVIDEILPHHPAPTVLPHERGAPVDSAVALASVIKSLLYLDNEAPNKKLRATIHRIGNRLRCYPLDRTRDPEIDYDGYWGGMHEIATAALWMFNLDRDPEFLRMGLSLIRSMPPSVRHGWRSIPAYTSSMLALNALAKDSAVDMINNTVRIGPRRYEPDAAAKKYIRVECDNDAALVNHLALVSKGDDQTLLMVLSHQPISSVTVLKNNRKPVVRDIVTNTLVSGKAPMHTFPFTSPWRYGLFTINP